MCVYIYIYIYTHHIFFIHSSFDGHLSCFHVLAIVNRAALNIVVHVSFQIMIFARYLPRSGIAGSTGSCKIAGSYSRRRGRQEMRWLGIITGSMDMSWSKLWELVKDRENLVCYSSLGSKESDMTKQLNNNKAVFSVF